MKREVCCLACAKRWQRASERIDRIQINTAQHLGPEEVVRVVEGVARRELCCDGCGMVLRERAPCAAVSVFLRGQSFIPWEGEYVAPLRPGAAIDEALELLRGV